MSVGPALTRTLPHPDPVVQEVPDIGTASLLDGQIPPGDLTAPGPRAAKLFVASSTADADLFVIPQLFDPDGNHLLLPVFRHRTEEKSP